MEYHFLSLDRDKEVMSWSVSGIIDTDVQSRAVVVSQILQTGYSTGIIRGLLCKLCNLGLGNFRDDILNLKRAIEYLEKISEVSEVHTVS